MSGFPSDSATSKQTKRANEANMLHLIRSRSGFGGDAAENGLMLR
jgi:hypothetical protein